MNEETIKILEDYEYFVDDDYDRLMVDKTNELENYEAIIIWVG